MKTKARQRIKHLLKILVGIVIAVTALAGAVLFWLIATMNTEAGRQRIESVVSRSLDREVRIGGPIGLDVSLWPRVVVEDLSISNPDWANTPLFVTVKRVEARVGVLPLLLRRLEVAELRAVGIRLWLEQRADGTANWQFGEWLKRKSVHSANIQHAQITFRTAAGREFQGDFSLLEASLAYDHPVQLHARGEYQGLPATVVLHGGALNELFSPQARWSMNGQAELGDSRLVFQGGVTEPVLRAPADLMVEARGGSLSAFEVLLERRLPTVSRYQARAQLRADDSGYSVMLTASANDLVALLPHQERDARSQVTAERIAGRVEAKGKSIADIIRQADWRLSAANGELRGKGRNAGFPFALAIGNVSVASDAGGPVHVAADASLNTVPFEFRAKLGPLADLFWGRKPVPLRVSLAAEGLESEFQGMLRHPIADGAFEGDLRFLTGDLSRLGRLAARKWPAVGPVRLSARLVRTEQSFHATDLAVEVGHSRFNGQLDLTPQAGPTVRLVITRGEIDLADFEKMDAIVQKPAKRSADNLVQEGRVIPAVTLPTEQVRRLDVELLLRRVRFVRRGDSIGELEGGRLRASDGRLSLELSGGRVISSGIKGRLNLNTAIEPPLLELHLDVEDLDYGTLLERLGLSDKVRGTLDFDVDLAGRGTTMQGALAGAEGSVTFTGGEGLIPRRLLELWGGGVLKALLGVFGGGDQTRLNCTAGRFSIKKGLLESDTLLVDTTDITVAGDIAVDLGTEELNGVFRARSKLGALVKMGRPVELSGTLAAPRARFAGSRIVELGKWIVGLSDPRTLILLFGELGTKEKNPCQALLEQREEGETQSR